jgi:hypothetical protein
MRGPSASMRLACEGRHRLLRHLKHDLDESTAVCRIGGKPGLPATSFTLSTFRILAVAMPRDYPHQQCRCSRQVYIPQDFDQMLIPYHAGQSRSGTAVASERLNGMARQRLAHDTGRSGIIAGLIVAAGRPS